LSCRRGRGVEGPRTYREIKKRSLELAEVRVGGTVGKDETTTRRCGGERAHAKKKKKKSRKRRRDLGEVSGNWKRRREGAGKVDIKENGQTTQKWEKKSKVIGGRPAFA